LSADFVFDDHYLIVNNPFLRSLRGVESAFTEDYYGQVNPQYALGYYRPLSVLSHWLDWQIWRENAFGHHLTNLIIHLSVVLLLYFLLRELFGNEALSFFASLIFALHPSHVGTVTFISGRVDALATFFSLLSLFVFMRKKALAPVSYFAALLFKEISVTTPVLIFWKEKERSWRSAFLWMVPFAAVLVIILIIRWRVLGNVIQPRPELSLHNVNQALLLIPAYLRFLVLPPFQLYLEPQVRNLPVLWNLLSLLIFVTGMILLRNRPISSWSTIWLVTLIPVLGLIRIETTLDERFLYLPSVSFCLLAAAWLLKYLQHRNKMQTVSHKHMLITGIIVSLIYAPFLLVRQTYWKNDLSLWLSAAETDPNSSTVRFRLGVAYLQAGMIPMARSQFSKGLDLPQENKAITAALYTHLAIAKQIMKEGNIETLYKKALSLDPNYFSAHFNLGLFYKQNFRNEEAIQQFEAALKSNPNSAAAHRHLAELLKGKGLTQKAETHLFQAQQLEH
jgi:protein O-mannosyl-transferase